MYSIAKQALGSHDNVIINSEKVQKKDVRPEQRLSIKNKKFLHVGTQLKHKKKQHCYGYQTTNREKRAISR